MSRGKFDDDPRYVIPPGGSSPLGNVGFVNAALELKEQIDEGMMPKPAVVYMAMGTMGACVGFAIGLRIAELSETELRCVRVSTPKYATESKMKRMIERTKDLLIGADSSLAPRLVGADAEMVHGYVGRGYAMPTTKGKRAVQLVRDKGGIDLDTTYTGKAFAALMDDARQLSDRVVLFWNTYDGRRLDLRHVSPRDLPAPFRGYFAGR
jgi:D-cysteine desulfhydrase